MVYCTDVTVDSADELPEGVCRGARLGNIDFRPENPKASQFAAVQLGRSEEASFVRHGAAWKKRRAHRSQSTSHASHVAGIRWSLGSATSRRATSKADRHSLERSDTADIDDSSSEADEPVPRIVEDLANRHPSVSASTASRVGIMYQNGVYDLHNDAFGMAIGDGEYNANDWGRYTYNVLSQLVVKKRTSALREQLLK